MENRSKSPTLDDGIKGDGFRWCVSFLEKRGRELFGEKFKIYDEDHEIIFKLIVYFIGDTSNAKKLKINLSKGLLFIGPIGCGKTSLMNLMRIVPRPERNHAMKPCREISFEFIQEGFEVIGRYSKMSFIGHNPKIYCFDDLGAEQSLKYYGNNCNVMGEILQSRYDLFISQRMITHITTNLSASELEYAYGNRLRSRMREMFNLIAFESSIDKRN